MKNSEDLVLFFLGMVTIGLTALLLFSLSSYNGTAIEKLINIQPGAEVAAQCVMPEPEGADVFDTEVSATFKKASAYLGGGRFEEKEHISLLERLEFYSALASVDPDLKKTAQDLLESMNHLQSVAREVKLNGQVNSAVTDAEMHLAEGKRNDVEAQKIMKRIENLHAIGGLTEDQNRRLRTALAALKNAYRPAERKVAAAPQPKPLVKQTAEPKSIGIRAAEPRPVPKATVVSIQPQDDRNQETRIVMEKYNNVMARYKIYWSEKKYRQDYHRELTSELMGISKRSDLLTKAQKEELDGAIVSMKQVDERYRIREDRLRSLR